MSIADIPNHWAQVDPGPLTADQIRSRARRLEREITGEHSRISTLESILAEYRQHCEMLEALFAREKRRTPQETK